MKKIILLAILLTSATGLFAQSNSGVTIYSAPEKKPSLSKKHIWEWRGCFAGLQTTKEVVDFPLSKINNTIYLSAYYGTGRINLHLQTDVPLTKDRNGDYPPLIKLGAEYKLF